jgi:hypothetical protein
MHTDQSAPEPCDVPAHDACGDPWAERIERQLCALDELVQIGMKLTRALYGQSDVVKPEGRDITLGFARLTRAVRRAIALQMRIMADAKLTAAERIAAQARHAAAVARAAAAKAAPSAARAGTGSGGREDLLSDLRERFDADEGMANKTYGDILRGICKDFSVEPDLSAFTAEDLARVYVSSAQYARYGGGAAAMAAAAAYARRRSGADGRPRPPPAAPMPSHRPPRAATGHDPP